MVGWYLSYLTSTITTINGLDKINYEDSEVPELTNNFLQHWLGTDAKLYTKAKDLIKQLKNTLKRSYDLAKTKVSNPIRLGARPKEPGYKSNAYPTVPTTLEEEVTPAPGRTENWVQESKFVNKTKSDLRKTMVSIEQLDLVYRMKQQDSLLITTKQ